MAKKESDKAGVPRIPELLAPAGNYEKLVTAIHYGADAIYLGGKEFGLRAKAGNFSIEDIEKGVSYCHQNNKKIYVTVNIFAHNRDLEGVREYLTALKELKVDGLIVSDPGILSLARVCVPEISLHLSTQANVTNHASANFWHNQGVSRLNLARELSLDEIKEIQEKTKAELEVFVHGALCISYSGRCMLSNYLTARDANKGHCSHPCRFNYAVTEEKRPGEFFPVEEDSRGTYIFNSKDLCLLQILPELIAIGVSALKIEGRMKSIFYVGGVVRVYREALNYLKSLPAEAWRHPEKIQIPQELIEEVEKTGTRGVTENFMKGTPGGSDMLYESSRAQQLVEPVGVVRRSGDIPFIEIRNTLESGEKLEYMDRGIGLRTFYLQDMKNEKGESLSRANPGNCVYFIADPQLRDIEVNSIIRRYKKG